MKNANKKQLTLILNPLERIARATEATQFDVAESNIVLSVNLKRAANNSHNELKKHTTILIEIRDLLRNGSNKKNKKIKGGGMKLPGAGSFATAAFAIVGISAALLISAGVLSIMPVPSMGQFITAIALVGLFALIIPPFIKLTEAIEKAGMAGKSKITGGDMSIKTAMGVVGAAVLAIVGVAAGIALASWAFMLIMPIAPVQFLTALAIGVVMIPLGFAFSFFIKGIAKAGIKMNATGVSQIALASIAMIGVAMGISGVAFVFNKFLPTTFPELPSLTWLAVTSISLALFSLSFSMLLNAVKGASIGELMFASLAIPIVALGIVGAAWVFQMLPNDYSAPSYEWSAKVGLSILVFTIPFVLIAYAITKAGLGAKELGLGLLGVVGVSIGIVTAAWIFSILPDDFKAPPLEWSMKAALSLTLFAIPLMLIGAVAAVPGVGAAAIGLGALGMILIAGTIWAVAWIFSALPTVDIGAIDALSRGLMSPIHAMIDVFKRFKDEIGIENMGELAGGLVMLSGAWLTLVAATAGQAVGGVLSSIGNLGSALVDGFASLFGADKPETPISILDKLLERGAKIGIIAAPLALIGKSFLEMTGSTGGIIESMNAIEPLTSEHTSSILEMNAASFGKIALAYEKIGVASQTINVKGIDASTKMFNALARLAEADGEDAMTVMAEKLMNAVKELSDVVENLEGVMSENGSQNKSLFEKLGSKFKDVVEGSAEKVKEIASAPQTVNVDMGPVILALNEIEDRLNMPLSVVVDDSI